MEGEGRGGEGRRRGGEGEGKGKWSKSSAQTGSHHMAGYSFSIVKSKQLFCACTYTKILTGVLESVSFGDSARKCRDGDSTKNVGYGDFVKSCWLWR